MDIIARNVSVSMVRENLADIPFHPVPAGYEIQPYRQGDEQAWVAIEAAADRYNSITPDLFVREFGNDAAILSQRQLFLRTSDGAPIGTSTAWFDPNHNGRPFGRIHWVAIVPEFQGRGLSKCLLSRTCLLLRELGHNNAYLVTSTARLPAIKLYRSFGFLPEIHNAADQATWTEMKTHMVLAEC